MKHLIAILFLGLLAAKAQNTAVATLSAGTPANVLSSSANLREIRLINNTASTITVRLYDSATASTNIVRPAHTSIVTYTTNFSVVVTNLGVVRTNTFSGLVSAAVTQAATTNELARLSVVAVPASATYTFEPNYDVVRGLTALSTGAATLQVTYE